MIIGTSVKLYDLLSALNADIGENKCIAVMVSWFLITNALTTLNVGDYDNTQDKIYNLSIYISLLKYTIHHKKVNR